MATVDFIRQLQPDVRQVFIVTGAATADKEYENAVRRQLPPSDSATDLHLFVWAADEGARGPSVETPAHSAVYYVLVSEDGAGQKFHPLEYVDRVAAAANAPTYCWVDSAMDHGIVGGSLYSQRVRLSASANSPCACSAANRPTASRSPSLNLNANQVDWRQLRRWRIDEARVPPGRWSDFEIRRSGTATSIYILAAPRGSRHADGAHRRPVDSAEPTTTSGRGVAWQPRRAAQEL